MAKIKVVGVDPALRNMGFAHALLDTDTMEVSIERLVLVETEADKKLAKVVRKNSDDLRRAKILHDAIVKECQGAAFVFIEVPVGSQSARAMASYGICIGVIAACPIEPIELNPTEVKLAVTGSKFATKQEMIEWATNAYPGANWLTRTLKGQRVPIADNEHLADACAAIHAGIQTAQFKQAVAMYKAMAA